MDSDRAFNDNLLSGPVDENVNRDIESEKALLSLCMRHESALADVVGKHLTAEDFADKRNALIFDAMSGLFMESKKVDRYTVSEALSSVGNLERAGGYTYVYGIAEMVSVISNLKQYSEIVREKSTLRKIDGKLNNIQKTMNSGKYVSNEIIDLAVSELSTLRTEDESTGFESIESILTHTIEELHGDDSSKRAKPVKTGFTYLDKMLGGFRPGSLNIIAARPGMGKSALALNIATNVAHNGMNVDIFSLEMSKTEIGTRILASQTTASAKNLSKAKISPEEEREFLKAIKRLANFHIYVDDRSDVSPVSMLSKLKELKAKGQLGLVIVDYLQLMQLPGRQESRQNEIAAISRSLKVMAKELDVPFIALSQLSRGAEKRDDHTPMLSDLRDSGAIEQDADTVIFIDRADYYKKDEPKAEIQDAYLYLSKNRHGELGRAKVKWWGAKTLFFEENNNTPEDPEANGTSSSGGSAYTRTTTPGAAASDYNFEEPAGVPDPVEPPAPPPPAEEPPFDADFDPAFYGNPQTSNNDGNPGGGSGNQANDDFFSDSHDDFPDGF